MKHVFLFSVLAILNIADAILTVHGINVNKIYEANPLMVAVAENLWSSLTVKGAALTFLAVCLTLPITRGNNIIRSVMLLCVCWYCIVVFWNAKLIWLS